MKHNRHFLLVSLALSSLALQAQELKQDYIAWGTSSTEFGQTLTD